MHFDLTSNEKRVYVLDDYRAIGVDCEQLAVQIEEHILLNEHI